MAGPQRLQLLVHDYSATELSLRTEALKVALPEVSVRPFQRRRRLLQTVAELNPAAPQGPWPLCLIDLQGSSDSIAKGEHLLGTINEHPGLTGRVSLIAFTRFGSERRENVLQAHGARAILSPRHLDRQKGLAEGLALLAGGSTDFAKLGEPPSREKDWQAIEMMAQFFPQLEDERIDETKRWHTARMILLVCRLSFEGCDDQTILRSAGIKRPTLKKLRRQLAASAHARATFVPAGANHADLGRFHEFFRPNLEETPLIWEATVERNKLRGPGRIEWAEERLAARYPDPREIADPYDDTWIPPLYLNALFRFLEIYGTLPKRSRSGREKPDPIGEAEAQLAAELGVEPERAAHFVTHAVMCLEDAEDERD
jgi:hypothetical protein